MKKILAFLFAAAKKLMPAAGELVRTGLRVGGKAGSLATSALRKKYNIRTRALRHRTRVFLRNTLAISLLVSAVSFMGLLLTHRK